jgi:prepilin-type processing-associated H-X9-DG protein
MARNFAAATDRIAYESTNILVGNPVSVAFRIKTTQATANVQLAARWSNTSRNGWGVILNNLGANKITIVAYDAGTQRVSATGTTTVNDGNWHSIVATFNGNNGAANVLYVDGVQDATANSSAVWSASNHLVAGGDSYDAFWPTFAGDMADFGYWVNTTLSADDAAAYARGFSAKAIRTPYVYAPWVRDHQARTAQAIAPSGFSGTTVTDHPRVIGSLV